MRDTGVILDGDDTLWRTQELYDHAKARFFGLLSELGYDATLARTKLAEIDVGNVSRLGFSRRRFPTSLRETYEWLCRRTGSNADSSVEAKVIAIGESVFHISPVAAADASAMLSTLSQHHRVILFTVGDASVQRNRIEQSGLSSHFDSVHITARKTRETWSRLLRTEKLSASLAWSVGNSIKSDINPALELGLSAVLLRAKAWEFEQAALTDRASGSRLWSVPTLTDALHVILANSDLKR